MRFGRLAAVAGSLALVTFGVAGAQAASTTQDIRQSDFDQFNGSLNDTRSGGHYDFLKEGLRVYTDSNTSNDKVAEYWAASGALPSSGAYDWYGTSNQPGAQIVFDADNIDGNGNDYNVLVGEQVYSANSPGQPLTDWWLTGGSSQTAKDAAPSSTGGSGSGFHGTLAEWKAALPNARVGAFGFSLGSGLKGDGVLRSETFDDVTYVFTDEAATTTQDVTGDSTRTLEPKPFGKDRTYRIDMSSDPGGANTTEGNKLHWSISVDGTNVAQYEQGFSEQDMWRWAFPKNSGNHTVQLSKNGSVVNTTTFSTKP